MSEPRTEGAAEFQLRQWSEGLLEFIEKHKAIPASARAQPAPRRVSDDQPLAASLFDYRRTRVVETIRSMMALIDEWESALTRPEDPGSARRLRDLSNALGRMRAMIQPAQDQLQWRDGEIPQRRFLSDPWPKRWAPPRAPEQPRTPRMAALQEVLRHRAFQLLNEGLTPTEISEDPERMRLEENLQIAQKAVAKRERHGRVPVIFSSDYPVLVRQAKLDRHARRMYPKRVEAWENAEGVVRRFVEGDEEAGAGDSVGEPIWLEPGTVADLLGKSGATVTNAARAGKVKGRQRGGRNTGWLIDAESAAAYWAEDSAALRERIASERVRNRP